MDIAIKLPHFSTPKAESILKVVDLELGQESQNWERLNEVLEQILQVSVSTDSKYFMNQLFSGTTPEMLLANEYNGKMRTTLATFEAAPVLSLIEMEVIKKLGLLIGWSHVEGLAVPGGSAANFMALHCARQRCFPDYKEKGMGQKKFRVFTSDQAHYSLKKACVALGFGTDCLTLVRSDELGKLSVEDLKLQVQLCLDRSEIPLMVCATAGTTVYGAFDPLLEISKVCRGEGIWMHVDGAWGGPVLFSDKLKPLMRGIEEADSMTFDAHKLLGANLTCSYFLTNDEQILLRANDVSGADYLFHEGSEVIDRGRLSWQCGRSADSLSFWTIWKSKGTKNLGQLIDRLISVRDETLEWIATKDRLQLVITPEFLNLCIQVIPPPEAAFDDLKLWSQNVREFLKANDLCFVNYAKKSDGTSFLRLILAHPEIDFATVKKILTDALAVL